MCMWATGDGTESEPVDIILKKCRRSWGEDYLGFRNDQFIIEPVLGAVKSFRVKDEAGRCLSPVDDEYGGYKAVMGPCNAADVAMNYSQNSHLRSMTLNLCLDVEDSSSKGGAAFVFNECSDETSQDMKYN